MTSTTLTREEVESIVNVEDAMAPVKEAIRSANHSAPELIRFIGRYASLNAWFGSGVAAFAGKIGRSRGIFMDSEEPIHDLADRSVLVASYFFDAARDEFDDQDTPHRDTHRCLAQAMIKGMIQYYAASLDDYQYTLVEVANQLLDHPIWLRSIGSAVSQGYGAQGPDTDDVIFRSMGYHVGSEILADLEFSQIDAEMRKERWDLVNYLSSNSFKVGDLYHNGYAWLSLHSGHGSSKEVDHFNWAVRGVEKGLSYVLPESRDEYRHQVHLGIADFVRDHREFFMNVSI